VRGSRGQAIVEFALIIPVLLAIATLAIDMANMVFVAHRLSAATREGSRIATETSLPTPENPSPSDKCTLAQCVSSSSICCIAVNRTNLVLFNSGVTNGTVTGEWVPVVEDDRRYVLLRVQASSVVNFFFGLGSQTINSASVSYGDDFQVT